jgi:hypothetical protein
MRISLLPMRLLSAQHHHARSNQLSHATISVRPPLSVEQTCQIPLIIILIRIRLSIPTPTRIILIPILISNLPATLPAPILPPLRKPLVQIRPNNALIQLRASNVLHAVQRVLVRVILDEAEAAGCFLEAVQPHDEALDFSAFGEEFVDLLLGRVEGEIADVQGGRVFELVFGFGRGGAVEVV